MHLHFKSMNFSLNFFLKRVKILVFYVLSQNDFMVLLTILKSHFRAFFYNVPILIANNNSLIIMIGGILLRVQHKMFKFLSVFYVDLKNKHCPIIFFQMYNCLIINILHFLSETHHIERKHYKTSLVFHTLNTY